MQSYDFYILSHSHTYRMVTVEGFTAGKAREKTFFALVSRFGTLKRGNLIGKMGCGSATFAHEYKDYLEQYPQIKYNSKTREFTFEP